MSIQQVTVAERATEEPLRIELPRQGFALLGRILISAIFLLSGFAKLAATEDTVGYMVSAGIPAAELLALIAGVAEVLGGLAILFGLLTRIGALGLFIYLIPTTLLFHDFWNLSGGEQQMQMVQFMKNLAIMGGLSLLVAYGPGHLSIDGKRKHAIQP